MSADEPKPAGGPERQDPPTITPRTEFGEQSTKSMVVARAGCPSEETLILLAAGVDDGVTRAAAVHAATCAMCKSQLALLVRDEHFVAGVRGMIATSFPGTRHAEERRPSQEEGEAFILPGYAVEGEIHRGGQGIVYRAIQLDTKRAVAVKMLLRGAFATPRELRRFEREVEIAASLRHPHIVTIYDNITLDDGRSALAMELVEGVTIDAWARGRVKGEPDRQPRTIRERAAMVAAIARAVQYAHNRAIIHRDLKPANVLVDAEDQPHVLDFGLARRTAVDHETAMLGEAAPKEASTFVSLAGIFNGTPAYASPEQLGGDPLLVDTRCDVYALGVVLYELATGRLPTSFDDRSPGAPTQEEGIAAIIAKKSSGRFPTPMEAAEITKSPRVDADLDAIIMRAMAVDKDKRYQTADRFAGDIDRYLAGEAVAARSGDRWYRARKTVRKHRKSLAASGVIMVAALGFGVYYAVVAARLDENAARLKDQTRTMGSQRDEIVQKRDALRAELDRSQLRLSRAELQLGSIPRAEAALIPVVVGTPGLDEAIASSGASASPEALRVYWALCEWAATSRVRASARIEGSLIVGAGPGNNTFWTCSNSGQVEEWSVPDLARRSIWTFDSFNAKPGEPICFDQQRVLLLSSAKATAWKVGSSQPVRSWPRSLAVTIRPVVGTQSIGYVTESGQIVREPIDPADGPPVVIAQRGPDPIRACWTSDGHFVATQEDRDGKPGITIWSLMDQTTRVLVFPPELQGLARQGVTMRVLDVDPSQKVFAIHWGEQILLWDSGTDRVFQVPAKVNEKAGTVRFARAGAMLAVSQAFTRRTLIYDRTPPKQGLEAPAPYFLETFSSAPLVVSSDPAGLGDWLVSWAPGLLRLWDVRESQWGREIGLEGAKAVAGDLHVRSRHCTTFSPDASMLASGSNLGSITIWSRIPGSPQQEWAKRELIAREPGAAATNDRVISDVAYSPDSRLLAATSYGGSLKLFDAQTDQEVARLTVAGHRLTAVCFSQDGKSIIYGTGYETQFNRVDAGPVVDTGGKVWRWDFASPQSRTPQLLWAHGLRVSKVARQPGGTLIASLSPDKSVKIGSASPGDPMTLVHPFHPRCLAFNPTGDLLATAADDRVIRLWDVRTGKVVKEWAGYDATCSDLVFHPLPGPPGKSILLLTLYNDGKIYVWDSRTGEQVASFQAHARERTMSISICPDASRFVTSGIDGTLKSWDFSWHKAHIEGAIDFWRKDPTAPSVARPLK